MRVTRLINSCLYSETCHELMPLLNSYQIKFLLVAD